MVDTGIESEGILKEERVFLFQRRTAFLCSIEAEIKSVASFIVSLGPNAIVLSLLIRENWTRAY